MERKKGKALERMTRNFTDINSERGQEKRTLEILQKAISESESPEEDFLSAINVVS